MTSIFVSLVLIGLFVFLYLKERKTSGFKAPTIFRVIVILLIILIVLANIFRFSYNQSPKIPVLVLVDASKSIDIGDNLAKIKEVTEKIKTEPFGKKFFSFSDSIGPLEDYEKASGQRTDIYRALDFAKSKRPGAIVLISDGQHNLRNDPTSVAQNIRAPIYTIGIGSEQKQDISIHSIRKPIRSFFGDTIEIVVRIQSASRVGSSRRRVDSTGGKGLENYSTKIKLETKGKLIGSSDIVFSGTNVIQEISFKVVPETIGKINYAVSIDTLPGEASYANNRKDFTVEVLKSRWQIVYLTNSPSFNTRFIIGALENVSGIESKSTNTFSVLPMVAFVGKNLEILKEMPIDPALQKSQNDYNDTGLKGIKKGGVDQAFQNADVIILDDINESYLISDVIAKIRNLTDQGKGLLILAGENFRPGSLFKDISPFELNANNIKKKDIFICLTSAGNGSPIFFNENGEYLLDNAPPLWGINSVPNIKPEATVWTVTKDDKFPVIGYRQYKNSKVIWVNGFPLWRLGFSSIETENQRQKFEQFLKNLVRFLAIKEFDRFKLITDKPDYLTGEDIIFNLLATTPDGRNWSGLDVKVEIPATKTSIPLFETSPGTYEGDASALTPGDYQVNAIVSKDEKLIGNSKTTFTVTRQSIEDITGLASNLLIKLSNVSEGKYYTTSEFLNETFIPKTIKYRRTLSFTFHNNPNIYIIITALFGILLYLRKKRGFL